MSVLLDNGPHPAQQRQVPGRCDELPANSADPNLWLHGPDAYPADSYAYDKFWNKGKYNLKIMKKNFCLFRINNIKKTKKNIILRKFRIIGYLWIFRIKISKLSKLLQVLIFSKFYASFENFEIFLFRKYQNFQKFDYFEILFRNIRKNSIFRKIRKKIYFFDFFIIFFKLFC